MRARPPVIRRKTGQVRREREGRWDGNFTIITLLLAAGDWWARPGSSRAGCQTGQGSSGLSAQAVWAPADFPALDTGTATGHSDSSSGTGLVSLRSARLLLARKIANKKSSLLAVAGFS